MSGTVHGGQQPVAGATIQLYTAGAAGNGSSATPMLTRVVKSDGNGSFDLGGEYACGESSTGAAIASASNQVYVVATGGNPGLAQGTNNSALVMMAALGSCANLSSATNVEINEVTTVAAAWALAPFIASYGHVGATSTNSAGIENAFLDAGLIADTSTGLAATLPANLSLNTDKLYALAGAIASCVNSDGTAGCTALFMAAKPSGGALPLDTLSAALNIVKHPGQNVVAVYNAIGSEPPFATGLKNAPNDWTLGLTITGGGLASPTSLTIDQESNVWVAGQDGPLSEFGPQGAPLSDTGYGVGEIAQVYAVAADSAGDIWVTNFNGPTGHNRGSVTEFAGSAAMAPAVTGSILGDYSNSVFYPDALSADTNGDMFIGDHDSSAVTVYSSTGAVIAPSLGADANLNAHPVGLAVDSSHGVWISDNDDTIAHVSAASDAYPNGQLLSHPNCCNETYGLATDVNGTVWVADYLGGKNFEGAFAEVTTVAGVSTVVIKGSQVGGLNHPAMVAVDGGQNIWFSNYRGASITEIAGVRAPIGLDGTALSPSTGVYGIGGYGLDETLTDPLGIAPDRAGNLWVANEGSNTVVMFFGLATPTVTPVQPVPMAP